MHQPDSPAPPMKRIYIIGLSGCGKTTLARCLAERLGLQHIEIDAINWGRNWQALPREVLREKVGAMIAGSQGWVADGNYTVVRELLWQEVDTIIWLDYPLGFVLGRLWRRTCKRIIQGAELWNGNHETLRGAFFSRDSLFLYVIRVFRKRRRLYTTLFAERTNPLAAYLRFRSARELERWMAKLKG